MKNEGLWIRKHCIWTLLVLLAFELGWSAGPGAIPKPKSPPNSTIKKVTLDGKALCPNDSVTPGSIQETARRLTVRIRQKNSKHLCSASLVGDSELLSSAHCFESEAILKDLRAGNLIAQVFENGKYRDISIRPKIATAEYKYSKDDSLPHRDFAILKLESKVEGQEFADLAQGSCDQEQPYVLAGFGHHQGNDIPECLKLSNYSLDEKSHESFLQFQLPNVASSAIPCNGDSGGPIWCKVKGKWAVSGIFSHYYSARGKEKEFEEANKEYLGGRGTAETLCRLTGRFVATRVDKWHSTLQKLRSRLAEELSDPSGDPPQKPGPIPTSGPQRR